MPNTASKNITQYQQAAGVFSTVFNVLFYFSYIAVGLQVCLTNSVFKHNTEHDESLQEMNVVL